MPELTPEEITGALKICTSQAHDNIHYWTVCFKDFSWQMVCSKCWHRLEQSDSKGWVVGSIFSNPELLEGME